MGRLVPFGRASMAQHWGLDRVIRCARSDEFARIRRRLSPPPQPVVKMHSRRTSALISWSRARLTPVLVAARESSIYHPGRNFRPAVSGSIDITHTCSYSDHFPDESHRPRHTIRKLVLFSYASSLLSQWAARTGRDFVDYWSKTVLRLYLSLWEVWLMSQFCPLRTRTTVLRYDSEDSEVRND